MKKVSIIIPVYNVREYIAQCLDSALSQTLSEIEILCVNDGSDDGSEDILRQYSEKYSDILVIIDQENAGQSIARNCALEMAKGEYVLFLDSDDFFKDETVVEKMYQRAKKDDLDLLAFNAVPVYDSEDSEKKDNEFKEYYSRSAKDGEVLPGSVLLQKLEETHDYKPSCCLNMCRLKIIRDNHITFYPGIIHEDNAFVFLAFVYSLRAEYVNEIYYMRRVRTGSTMTSNKSLKNVVGYTVACYQMMDRITDLSIEESTVESVIKRIQITLNNAVEIFNTLNEETLNAEMQELDLKKRALFDVMVKNPQDKYNCIRRRLEKAYNERSELNQKLQQTYAEKSEINAKLKKTYEEKSEINAKLQQTYDEKAERGKQIRALTVELQREKEKIEKQKLSIAEYKEKSRKLENRLKKKEKKYDELFVMYKNLEKRSIICWIKKLLRWIREK